MSEEIVLRSVQKCRYMIRENIDIKWGKVQTMKKHRGNCTEVCAKVQILYDGGGGGEGVQIIYDEEKYRYKMGKIIDSEQ